MLHIIGIPNCDKIKKTKDWFTENGIDFGFINTREEPLTLDELKDLEYKIGLDVLINSRSATYRELGIKDQNLDDEALLKVLEQNQTMMKRPILVFEESVLVGYDEEAFENFAKEHNLIQE